MREGCVGGVCVCAVGSSSWEGDLWFQCSALKTVFQAGFLPPEEQVTSFWPSMVPDAGEGRGGCSLFVLLSFLPGLPEVGQGGLSSGVSRTSNWAHGEKRQEQTQPRFFFFFLLIFYNHCSRVNVYPIPRLTSLVPLAVQPSLWQISAHEQFALLSLSQKLNPKKKKNPVILEFSSLGGQHGGLQQPC